MNHLAETRDRSPLRWGAASGVSGVVVALVQTAINPSYPDNPEAAIQQASLSHFLTFSRAIDMSAFLLMLVGMTVVTSAISRGRGALWAGVARNLFTVSAAAGAIATMLVGSFPDIAASWAEATPALKPGYVAAYDALGNASGGIFSVSWAALGIFGIVFSVAVRRSEAFSNTLGWISAASGVALLVAVVLGVGFQAPAAFLLLVLGLLLSYVVIVASGLKLWRLTGVSAAELQSLTEPLG